MGIEIPTPDECSVPQPFYDEAEFLAFLKDVVSWMKTGLRYLPDHAGGWADYNHMPLNLFRNRLACRELRRVFAADWEVSFRPLPSPFNKAYANFRIRPKR